VGVKPYREKVEARETEGENEVADRAWEAHLARNDSRVRMIKVPLPPFCSRCLVVWVSMTDSCSCAHCQVVEIFQGQYRSIITCPVDSCGNVSITFDPFMYLSLPVPVNKTCLMPVYYCPSTGSTPIR